MARRLGRQFFDRTTIKVAKELLGCYVVRKVGQHHWRVRITETEAYVGSQDKASHASHGRTKRTEIMFGESGRLYVYLIYGMYYCLNVVTDKVGYPAAVLIRAVTPVNKNSKGNSALDGPGKVCRYLKVNKRLNGENVTTSQKLWLEHGKISKGERIVVGKRVGVPYAGKWQHKPWRFCLVKKSPSR